MGPIGLRRSLFAGLAVLLFVPALRAEDDTTPEAEPVIVVPALFEQGSVELSEFSGSLLERIEVGFKLTPDGSVEIRRRYRFGKQIVEKANLNEQETKDFYDAAVKVVSESNPKNLQGHTEDGFNVAVVIKTDAGKRSQQYRDFDRAEAISPDFTKMEKLIATATPVPPDEKAVWVGQQVFYKENSKPKVGSEFFDRKLIPFPAKVTSVNGDWLWIGRAWIKRDEVRTSDQAMIFYADLVRKNPKNTLARSNRGAVCYARGEMDNAIDDQTEVIRLTPNSAAAFTRRGMAWAAKGEFDNAVKDLTDAIRIDPNNAMAYFHRGTAWQANAELDKAIKDFTDAIKLDPTDSAAYCSRGAARQTKADPENALKDYAEAIRINPIDVEAYNGIAWVRATCPNEKFRDGKEAVKYGTKACELTAWKDAYNINTLAAAYAESGDFTKAIEWETKAQSMYSQSELKQLSFMLDLYKSNKPYRVELRN